MVRKWAHGLILGLLLGSIFAAFPEAQNYLWSSINGIPYAPAIGLVRGTPSVTTDVLYNSGGMLYFNGSAVGTSWPLTAPAGGAIQTGTTAADTLLIQAYDVDGTAYTPMLTLTAGNTPTLELTANKVTIAGTSSAYIGGVGSNQIAALASSGATLAKLNWTAYTYANTGTLALNVLNAGLSTVYTNEGDGDGSTLTLPAPGGGIVGLQYSACVQAAQTLTITAGAGDTIRIAGSVTLAAGSITSNVVGSCVTLVAINNTEWIAISSIGTWSF